MNYLYAYLGKDWTMSGVPRTEQWLEKYNNLEFYKLFRMGKSTFEKLCEVVHGADKNNILKKKYTGGYKPVSLEVQILVFVHYMATQDIILYIGNRFQVSTCMVMIICNRVLYFILKLKTKYIHFPKTEQDLLEISRNFTTYPGM